MKKLLCIFIYTFCNLSGATIPTYNAPLILARANINDGFNMPAMSFINNASPVINDHGDVAFKVAAIAGESAQGLWIKTSEDLLGKILYTAPLDRMVTDPSINEQSKLAFNLFEEGVTDGLFTFDAKKLVESHVLPATDLHLQSFTYPVITNNDEIFFRGTDENNARSFFLFGTELNTLISEGTNNTSYLFKPSVNDEGSVVFKARLGKKGQWDENSPDQIILMNEGTRIIIAEDRDSKPTSPFLGFGNSLSISSMGLIAFTGIVENNQKGIFVYNHQGVIKNIAMEGKNNISEIETFAVKINDEGLVVFRAKDNEGRRSIFVADGSSVIKLIGEGDEIESDTGKSKILLNQYFPGFGGEIDMNNNGDIVFNCTLVHVGDDRELGQAVYVINHSQPLIEKK
jgi:hypothetical protein